LEDITEELPIYIADHRIWVAAADCVWRAPVCFCFKYALSKYENHDLLYSFFITGLGVPKIASLEQFMDGLKGIQDRLPDDAAAIAITPYLYKEIRELTSGAGPELIKSVR
jgi:hypothetical protein